MDSSNELYQNIASEPFTRDQALQIMSMVHDHYRMDVEQIWKRGAVYLTISSALVALTLSKDFDIDQSKKLIFLIFGLVVSIFWMATSLSSWWWIARWRNKMSELDSVANPIKSFSDGEMISGTIKSHLIRPQVYAVTLSIIFVLAWILLIVIDS